MKIRRLAISAAVAAGVAALPLASATAQQPYPPPPPPPPYYAYPACSPFPLAWPFCVAGAVVGLAAAIVTAPFAALAGVPPAWAYYRPPPFYYPPPPDLPGYPTTPGAAPPGYSPSR